MLHTGVVREVREGTAVVAVDGSGCGACSARGACFSLSGKAPGERILEARNDAGAGIGDTVEVEFRLQASMTSISVTFLVPVALMGAGYVIAMPGGTSMAALGAGAGLAAGLFLAWAVNRMLCRRPGYGLSVRRVVEPWERGKE
jgi:positive regulator of sigma E activity